MRVAPMSVFHSLDSLLCFQLMRPPPRSTLFPYTTLFRSGVVVLLHHLPAVDRIAPALPGLAEVIRWHSRNKRRVTVLIEVEQLWISPDVGAVMRHVTRQVTENADVALVTIGFEPRPLLMKQKLPGLLAPAVGRSVTAQRLHRVIMPLCEFGRPVGPGSAFESSSQRHELGVVIEPVCIGLGIALERISIDAAMPALEIVEGKAEQTHARWNEIVEVDLIGCRSALRHHVISRDQSELVQVVDTNKERVGRECRRTGIRRMAETGGHER